MATEYLRSDQFVYRHIAGEHLLVSLHRSAPSPLFAFTPTAAALWRQLETWSTSDDLVAQLVDHYDVTAEQAASDVREFLGQLQSLDALAVRESMICEGRV